jgi:hypothetical protein
MRNANWRAMRQTTRFNLLVSFNNRKLNYPLEATRKMGFLRKAGRLVKVETLLKFQREWQGGAAGWALPCVAPAWSGERRRLRR